MAYSKHYPPSGFQNGASGGTPITAEVCNDWENELVLLDSGGNNITVNQGIARPTGNNQTLANLLSQIAMLLKEIKGTTNWYDANTFNNTNGGTLSGNVNVQGNKLSCIYGDFGHGTGDGANYNTYNVQVGSWWSIGFYNKCNAGTYPNQCSIYMDLREGQISTKGRATFAGINNNNSLIQYSTNDQYGNGSLIQFRTNYGGYDKSMYMRYTHGNGSTPQLEWINNAYSAVIATLTDNGSFGVIGTINAAGGCYNNGAKCITTLVKVAKNWDTIYQATEGDGFIIANAQSNQSNVDIYCDDNSNPTTRYSNGCQGGTGSIHSCVTVPVKKNQYYKCCGTNSERVLYFCYFT